MKKEEEEEEKPTNERNVSGKEDPCCKSNKSFPSSGQKEFPTTMLY